MEMDFDTCSSNVNIDDLPEEILEFILSKVSPYRDVKSCMLVCRRWYRLAAGVTRQLRQTFQNCVYESKVKWTKIAPEIDIIRVTERYSHCACYYDKSLYVFGGCTSMNTTFNDLWRFDLARREWIRPLAMGTYPSPKACSSMVVYKDSLVLFGGWSHPTPYPLHQAAGFFYELHMYKPEVNRWYLVTSISREHPPPTAGHSASIVKDTMLLFGGSSVPGIGTNDLWRFDFIDLTWKKIVTENKRPSPRFGQTQVTVDDQHILVIGGCGGPNQIFNDMWLLSMDKDPWEWTEVKVNNTDCAAPQLWCHPACKIGNMITVLSKPTKSVSKPASQPSPNLRQVENIQQNRVWVPPVEREIPPSDRGGEEAGPSHRMLGPSHYGDQRYNSSSTESDEESVPQFKRPSVVENDSSRQPSQPGRSRLQPSEPDSKLGAVLNYVEQQKKLQLSAMESTSSVRTGSPSVRPNANSNRQKQLEALRKMEEKLRENMAQQTKQKQTGPSRNNEAQNATSSRRRDPHSQMHLHVLDIAEVVQGHVTWRPIDESFSIDAPDETIFYSLSEGRGELIMFGGIQRDIQSMQRGVDLKSHLVSNILYILSPLKTSI
ncbi:F-box only protein 42-like [Mytilus edulis]|uniref:F-box only protein 42-like n=1 Tax=Mytilus edulis TaxID=6550 RepID=UPI0039F12C6B